MSSLPKLRDHQVAPVRELLGIFSRRDTAVDLSDCGTGKTYVACAVISELKTPTLVICPKIACTQWRAAAAHFGDSLSVIGYEKLRTGRTPYGRWERQLGNEDRDFFKCQCCQLVVDFENFVPCYCHPLGIHCIVRKTLRWNYGKFTFNPAVRTVIFDEIHRCGSDSLNSDMLIAAKRQGLRVLGLSATLASTPIQLRAIGYALDLFPHPAQFAQWARKYKVRYDASFHGYHWFASDAQQATILANIRRTIIPDRGVRVTTGEIPNFPEVEITAELYDLDEAPEIARIQRDMVDALRILDQRVGQDVETPLTIQLRAHQRVELLKVPLAVELAQDYLAKGISVGIFVTFKQTMSELRRLLKCDCFIDGSPEGVRSRQCHIDRFQNNEAQLILVNSNAGREALSLHDLHGGHPRGGLVFPGYSATALRQVFGRFPRDGGHSRSFYRVLLAANTGDVAIHRALRAKMNNLDALNDADLLPNNLSFSEH